MRYANSGIRCGVRALLAILILGGASTAANGAVSLLGVQYQQDELFPEFNCIWHDKNYPTSCSGTYLGGNIHVYVKNTGSSSVTITDVTLAGYSLTTILPESATAHNSNSIYYYWDNPPADILAAGTPVWFKGDPSTIPAGGVAQAVIRLRSPPTTATVSMGVVTSGGTVNATIPIDANAAQLASVGFSQDRSKVYLHWRRSGGAAPASVLMDGVDVTANTTTVGDASTNYAASVINLASPLPYLSYHVYQGVYADGKTATGSLRTWSHQFIHASWGTFEVPDGDLVAGKAWVDDAINRGFNAVQNQMNGGVGNYLSTINGRTYAESRGYRIIAWNKNYENPIMTFINDEVDAEEDNVGDNFCGTGKKLPCGGSPMGILGLRSIAVGEDFRSTYPQAVTTINMDGTFKPENYYSYGQLADVLQVDPYYQKRLKDTYWYHNPGWIPLYNKATYNYAVAKAVTRAAEPNSSHIILQSCQSREDVNGVTKTWPFPTAQSKRIEVYYSLAAGAKGISYWWFKPGYPSNGLSDQSTQTARDLWREMGVYGNEIKTISPQLVISHPVDMALAPSTNVWARALASGTDTIILLAVNDDYYNDEAACHYTPVANATVTATLPTWMQASPTAFEVTASGIFNVSTQLNGSQLQVNLGTLDLTRMIVITTNAQLRAAVEQRYEQEVQPGVCAFAPELCSQHVPPAITLHPSPTTLCTGGNASFSVLATGQGTITYQWQKNSVNVTNGGHYSGCTTPTLTVSSLSSADAANYRCTVSNEYGSTNTNQAALTVLVCNPNCLTNLGFENGFTSGIGNGWTKFTSIGSITCSDSTTEIHGGAHAQAIFSAAKNNAGGVFQQFATTPNQPYTIKAWFKCKSNDGSDGNMEGLFGIDVTGGTDPNSANIEWSSKPYLIWSQDARTVTAQGNSITLFLLGRATRLNKPGYVYFDDIQLAPGSPTTATPQAIGPASIRWRWTDLGMETGYRVRDGAGVDKSGLLPADLTEWTETTGIVPNTQYTRYIYATNSCGESDPSAAETAYSLIEAPTGVTFGTVTESSIVATPVGSFTNLTSGSSGVQVINGTAGTNSGWQTSLSAWTSSGLVANTAYDFVARARNASGAETGDSATQTRWTLSAPPVAGSVVPDRLCPAVDQDVIWTAVGGFGFGTIDHYRYAWDQSPTHTWTDSESIWSNWTIVTTPTISGTWYLHVRGYNGENVANGSFDYMVTSGATVAADFDADCDVDEADFSLFAPCVSGPAVPFVGDCGAKNLDGDEDVDLSDFGIFQRCYSGAGNPADPNCVN